NLSDPTVGKPRKSKRGELQGIHSEFVKKVKISVIRGLLGDLWQQKVFSTEDKDSVMEKGKIKTDMARCLIDMVIRKGEKASRIMIDSMKKRDPDLCSTLGLISSPAGVGQISDKTVVKPRTQNKGELQRIHSEFVKTVKIAVTRGLLDDLLQQKVFSTEDKDSVMEKGKIKTDMARCLIDMVIGKGEKQSRIMIESMKKRDPDLCSTLGLISSPAGVGQISDKTVVKPRTQNKGELQRIHSEFVKTVKIAVTRGLLDDLLQQKVFSTEDKDSVMEKGKIKTDMARCLIDMVIGKGEKQSRIMIESMKKRDPDLCSTLGLISSPAGVGNKGDKTLVKPTKQNKGNGGRKRNGSKSEEVSNKKPCTVDVSDSITETRSTGQNLTEKELMKVADTLGQEWEPAAIHLELTTKDLDDIKAEHRSVVMQKLKMLVLWTRRRPSGKATAQDLLRGLEDLEDLPFETRVLLKGLRPSKNRSKPVKKKKPSCSSGQGSRPGERSSSPPLKKPASDGTLDASAEIDEDDEGLVFEVSEQALVRYSVLSWFQFSEFLKDSWRPAGSIWTVDVVNNDLSVLKFIHFPHSLCLAEPEHELSFSVLLVKGSHADIESTVDFTESHVKWPVSSLSAAGLIIPSSLQAKHHGAVLVYKNGIHKYFFQVYLCVNSDSEIKAIQEQVNKYRKKCIKMDKPAPCNSKLVAGKNYHLTSKPEGKVEPSELNFNTDVIGLKGFFEARFEEHPPFRLFLRDSDCDKPLWSATITEEDLNSEEPNIGQKDASAEIDEDDEGLVFEVSEQALVHYSVRSWSEFSEFLSRSPGDSWRPAGSIYDVIVVNKDPSALNKDSSVLKFIHFPHSLCLAEPEHELSFSVLHVKGSDDSSIESKVDFTASHVKWRVTSLSPVGPIILSSLPAKHHAMVLIYNETNHKYFFDVYLVCNNDSEIKAIEEQVNKSNKECDKIYKPASCISQLVAGNIYHLTSKPEGKVEPSKINFNTDVIGQKGFSEARFDERPPFRLFLMDGDEHLWSATITEEMPGRTSDLVLSSEQFKTEKLKDRDNIYAVMAPDKRTRMALLITNVRFDHLSHRDGAEKDEEDMRKLLISLGYNVKQHRDLSGAGMDEAVKSFSKDSRLATTDSVIVVIMSHGVKGAILGVNHSVTDPDQFPIDNIYKHLESAHCPKLEGKPKVIIIQACRGDKDGSAIVTDGPGSVPEQAPVVQVDVARPPHLADPVDENIEEDVAIQRVHKEKDFVSLLSCTADTVSYRHPQHGSFFIQYIVDIFNRHAREDHIVELFRKASRSDRSR
ncbi:unnamed protein product, partial [Gadus morhua 'NCC']